jgi:hypothetical protein
MTNNKKMTVKEIRTILFNTEKYTVIGHEEMTNKESRGFLYSIKNQDTIYNVLDQNSHLLIWE